MHFANNQRNLLRRVSRTAERRAVSLLLHVAGLPLSGAKSAQMQGGTYVPVSIRLHRMDVATTEKHVLTFTSVGPGISREYWLCHWPAHSFEQTCDLCTRLSKCFVFNNFYISRPHKSKLREITANRVVKHLYHARTRSTAVTSPTLRREVIEPISPTELSQLPLRGRARKESSYYKVQTLTGKRLTIHQDFLSYAKGLNK